MKHVIYLDPEKDVQIRHLFRSMSPRHANRKTSPTQFQTKVYPKMVLFQKKKEQKLAEAKRQKEIELSNSIVKHNYTTMYDKKVRCHNSKPFLERNQEVIERLKRKKQRVNQEEQERQDEDFKRNCTFNPRIDRRAQQLKKRKVEDWYKWEERKMRKRNQRMQAKMDAEISECVGRFRSPGIRKQPKHSHPLKNQ